MTFIVREWRNDAISSGARRFLKWCTALEQWLSAVGYNFVSDFIFFKVGK